MISQYLTENTIQVNVECINWEESIQAAGELLVNSQRVKKEYVQAMIDVVHEFGPYIVICPGVAFAHARPSSGVISPGLSLITLKEPIDFGNNENDPVKLVFAFAGVDHSSHIELLSKLAVILDNEKAFNALINSTDLNEIISIIKREEV